MNSGEYDSHASKDVTLRSGPAAKMGTGARDGRTPQAKSLSLSRSMQHGINWHVPAILTQIPGVGGKAMKDSASSMSAGRGAVDDGGETGEAPANNAPGLAPEPSWEETVARLYTVAPGTKKLPPPVGGKPPPPPAAVARSARKADGPADWDWQRLGHNYRSCFTTCAGGAYSHGAHQIISCLV